MSRVFTVCGALLVVIGCGNVESTPADAPAASNDAPGASDAPPSDAPVTPDAPGVSHRIFITRASFNGNLGGIAGADAKCQAVAEARGFGGLWRAFLSTTNVFARDRLPAIGRFVRVTGEVVANSREDMLDGSLIVPVLYDETGLEITPNRAWTGSAANGTVIAGNNCDDWTLGTTTTTPGLIGDATSASGQWINLQNSGCGGMQRLYCYEE